MMDGWVGTPHWLHILTLCATTMQLSLLLSLPFRVERHCDAPTQQINKGQKFGIPTFQGCVESSRLCCLLWLSGQRHSDATHKKKTERKKGPKVWYPYILGSCGVHHRNISGIITQGSTWASSSPILTTIHFHFRMQYIVEYLSCSWMSFKCRPMMDEPLVLLLLLLLCVASSQAWMQHTICFEDQSI